MQIFLSKSYDRPIMITWRMVVLWFSNLGSISMSTHLQDVPIHALRCQCSQPKFEISCTIDLGKYHFEVLSSPAISCFLHYKFCVGPRSNTYILMKLHFSLCLTMSNQIFLYLTLDISSHGRWLGFYKHLSAKTSPLSGEEIFRSVLCVRANQKWCIWSFSNLFK